MDEGREVTAKIQSKVPGYYDLWKKIASNAVINLYGDVNQLVYSFKGIYNWSDINIFSKADLRMEDTCALAMPTAVLPPIDIQPNDINVSDTATFIWEIQ